MEIRLSTQQAFELGAFLKVPSNKFASVTEARKASSVRSAFEKAIPEYYKVFENLAKENNELMQEYRDKYQSYVKTKVKGELPSQEASQAKASELDKKLKALMKEIEDKAESVRLSEGEVKLKIKLDRNDFDFLSDYFEKQAVQFQLWQDTAKLEEMALLLESVK